MKTLPDQPSESFRRRNPHLYPVLAVSVDGSAAIVDDAVDREADLHDAILAECHRRGFYVVHSRMDLPSTNGLGTPDFIIAMPGGQTLWVECKTRTGKLTREQLGAKVFLEKNGHPHFIVRSVTEFNNAVNQTKL